STPTITVMFILSLLAGANFGEGWRDPLQGLAPGIDPEHGLDPAADDHDAAADQVPDGQVGAVAAVADQRAVEGRSHGSDDRGHREEDCERFGPDLDREDLAYRQVAGARPGGGEEEDDDPDEGLPRGRQDPRSEQPGAEGEHAPGYQVRAGDHLLAPDTVEQLTEQQRAGQVANRECEAV